MPLYLGYGITFPIADAGDITASGIAFIVVSTILTSMRSLARTIRGATLDLTDIFGIIAWLVIIGMDSVFIWSAGRGGLGWPTLINERPLTATHITSYQRLVLQSEYVFCILMVVALGTTKLSILYFFRSIFLAHKRTSLDYLTRALIVVVSLWTAAFTMAFALECGGYAAAFWQPLAIRVQHCLPIDGGIAAFEKACGITDLVLDVFCVALPFPIIWRLQMRTSRKLSITAIFLVRLMTIAAGVARLVIWVEVLNTASNPTEDVNLAVAMSLCWGMIEVGLGFIASQWPVQSTYLDSVTHRQIADSIRSAASVISLRSISGNRSMNRLPEDQEHQGQPEIKTVRSSPGHERSEKSQVTMNGDGKPSESASES